MKTKILRSLAAFTVVSSLVLAGCGSNNGTTASAAAADSTVSVDTPKAAEEENAADSESLENDIEVKKVIFANAGSPKPYNWMDEDGILQGYEPEILRAVDELLPEYEFDLVYTEFASIFSGIDAGLYDAGFNYITKKPEREEKYYFANQAHMYVYKYAVVRKGDDSIHGIEDLGGKTAYKSGNGNATDLFYDDYNDHNPDNPINAVLTSADTLKYYQDLVDGSIDFFFSSKPSATAFFESYPDYEEKVDFVQFSKKDTETIEDPYGWFIYPKTEDGEKLRDAVDGALIELKENGTLSELSQKYLGFDYVEVENTEIN